LNADVSSNLLDSQVPHEEVDLGGMGISCECRGAEFELEVRWACCSSETALSKPFMHIIPRSPVLTSAHQAILLSSPLQKCLQIKVEGILLSATRGLRITSSRSLGNRCPLACRQSFVKLQSSFVFVNVPQVCDSSISTSLASLSA
jgi:hypothetical protein